MGKSMPASGADVKVSRCWAIFGINCKVLAARQIPECALVIVDPVVTAVTGDSHKNTEVRRALRPLVGFASDLGTVALGISHFTKGTAGRDPVERVTGSVAFGALPRVVMAAARVRRR